MNNLLQIPIINWLYWIGLITICGSLPVILTIVNIINLFKKKKIHPAITDILTFTLGIGLTFYLYNFLNFSDYAPIASSSMLTIITILVIGVISYTIIRIKKVKWSPLVIIVSMGGILICSIEMLIFIVQISNKLISTTTSLMPFFVLFPLNYILCSLRAKREIIQTRKEELKENKVSIINDPSNWEILSVIFAIVIFIVMTGVLMLFGQRADELIKAFSQTKGWLLSIK